MTWEICPECRIGRGQDHRKGCSGLKPPPIKIHGRGTPLEAISPGRPQDGTPEVLALRRIAAKAQKRFLAEMAKRS